MNWKSFVRSLPVVGPISYMVRPDRPFKSSGDYWDRRYRAGGTSGAGSYNRLAEFKAEVINDLIQQLAISSVIEFGCGDGAQLELARYPTYVGVDVSPTVLEQVRRRFARRPEFKFLHTSEISANLKADLGLSLDVIYHLIEDDVFEAYMRQLFDATRKVAVIYASNKDEVTGSAHVRHRCFTNWVKANRPDFLHMKTIRNRYPFDPADPDNTSFADFYVYRFSDSWNVELPLDDA